MADLLTTLLQQQAAANQAVPSYMSPEDRETTRQRSSGLLETISKPVTPNTDDAIGGILSALAPAIAGFALGGDRSIGAGLLGAGESFDQYGKTARANREQEQQRGMLEYLQLNNKLRGADMYDQGLEETRQKGVLEELKTRAQMERDDAKEDRRDARDALNREAAEARLNKTLSAAYERANLNGKGSGKTPFSPAVAQGITDKLNGRPVSKEVEEQIAQDPEALDRYLRAEEQRRKGIYETGQNVRQLTPKQLDELAEDEQAIQNLKDFATRIKGGKTDGYRRALSAWFPNSQEKNLLAELDMLARASGAAAEKRLTDQDATDWKAFFRPGNFELNSHSAERIINVANKMESKIKREKDYYNLNNVRLASPEPLDSNTQGGGNVQQGNAAQRRAAANARKAQALARIQAARGG